MPSVFSSVKVSTRRAAVWRACAGCTVLAALAPNESHCRNCKPPATAPAAGQARRPLAA